VIDGGRIIGRRRRARLGLARMQRFANPVRHEICALNYEQE
jgi:hypothetical protein